MGAVAIRKTTEESNEAPPEADLGCYCGYGNQCFSDHDRFVRLLLLEQFTGNPPIIFGGSAYLRGNEQDLRHTQLYINPGASLLPSWYCRVQVLTRLARQYSDRGRNAGLAAIHSFFRYAVVPGQRWTHL